MTLADLTSVVTARRASLVLIAALSVSEALAKADGSADAVQKSLLGNGVGKKDLQTSGLNIAPIYDYTKSAGRSLGAAASITETVVAPSPISMPLAAMSQAKQADVPIQPGSQEVGVTVTVVFAMRWGHE